MFDIARKCKCKKGHILLCATLVKNGKRQCNGRHAHLRRSGTYPKALGRALLKAAFRVQAERKRAPPPLPAATRTPRSTQQEPSWMRPPLGRVAGARAQGSTDALSWLQPAVGCLSTGAGAGPSWLQPLAGPLREQRGWEASTSRPAWLQPSIGGPRR